MAVKPALALLALSCLGCVEAQTLEHVSISQLSVESAKLTAYLDIRGADDRPLAGLQPSSLQPILDEIGKSYTMSRERDVHAAFAIEPAAKSRAA